MTLGMDTNFSIDDANDGCKGGEHGHIDQLISA